MANVTVFSTNVCPYCNKLKSFLGERGIEFTEVDSKPGSQEWEEMRRKTSSTSLPQILIDDKSVGGYSDIVNLDATGELSTLLGLAKKESPSTIYDVIIIGGGPAGLSAAIYAARKVLKTIIITKNIGGQVADTYDIENYLGFSQIETADLINKFDEHVEKYGVEKVEGEDVVSIELTGKIKKVVTTSGDEYYSKTLILATGKRPRHLNVPGEDKLVGKGVAYCSTCDAPLFANADVAVIGGGNSALEAVIDLDKVAKKIHLISLTPLTGDQVLKEKVENSSIVDIYTKYNTLKIIGDAMVEGIEIQSLDTGEKLRFDVEGIFIEIGLLPNSEIVIDTLDTNRQGEITVDNLCKTGIAGVFACGDVTTVPYKQVVIAAGEGAKAALSAYDYIINQK
ncbi:MAG: FAD-dependent oxidoreductase [Spirochaetota bacterium]|nr:FAD-dependent oxidoreductase [Spirochaetota bacterium]